MAKICDFAFMHLNILSFNFQQQHVFASFGVYFDCLPCINEDCTCKSSVLKNVGFLG